MNRIPNLTSTARFVFVTSVVFGFSTNLHAAPTVNLTASPTSVSSGGSSNLTWSTSGATTCTASGSWSGSKAVSGSQSSGALYAKSTFTLSCTGSSGTTAKSITVMQAAPVVSLSASPSSVPIGSSATLSWTASNTARCQASGSWVGAKAVSGNQSTGNLSANASYTLTCVGPGGSTARTTSVAVTAPPSTSPFPLTMNSGGRYLKDAQGRPFLLHGDTAWLLITELTREKAELYLENRRQKGFNAVLVELIETANSTNKPKNIYGVAPFTKPGDFSTPNDAYFDHAEWVVAKAREKGIVVLLTAAYLGYGGRSGEGWYQEMVASGPTKMTTYGQYLADRFAGHDNVLWVQGGDYNPPNRSVMRAVPIGIQNLNMSWLHTFHGGPGTNALEFINPGEDPWMTVNNVYAYEDDLPAALVEEYQRGTMPFFMIESRYEGEGSNTTDVTTRRQAYQSYLTGAFGHVFGNRPIWLFDPGWETALNADGSADMVHVKALITAFPWWTLEPDVSHQILTTGRTSSQARSTAVAARTSDRATVLAYVPTLRSVTINLGQLKGPRVQARWYDPSNGVYTTVTGSPFTASGSRSFNAGKNNASGRGDWALVLQSVP